MSKTQTTRRSEGNTSPTLGRRDLLKGAVVDGAALGATIFFGALGTTLAAQDEQRRQRNIELLKTLPIAHRRRVVTGHNTEGQSYIVSDELIADNRPGHMDLWVTDPAQPLGSGPSGEPRGILSTTSPHVDPPRGGTRWYVATVPTGANSTATFANREGMHRTLTIDYVFVLSGEITMLMDIPPEVTLRAGDVVIQRNTMHSWRVDGNTPAVLLASLVRVE